MSDKEAKRQAEILYVQKGRSVSQIAEELNVPLQTVYRWRKDAEQKDSNKSWDNLRQVWLLSPREMHKIFSDSVKHFVLEIKKHPEKLADPKIADAISKHLASIERINPKYNYLGAILDLIQKTNDYLEKTDPQLAKKMQAHWPAIKDILTAMVTKAGLDCD